MFRRRHKSQEERCLRMSTVNTNTATLTVTTPPPPVVASASLTLDSNSVNTGQSDVARVTLFDSSGHVIPALPSNASITYTSSNTSVATLNANGDSGNPLQSTITTLSTGSTGISAVVTQ